MKSIYTFLILIISVFSSLNVNAQVVINEYSCSNVSTITDNFNEYEDWIELFNSGAASVNLQGYYLSDSKGNPLKWQFDNISIPAQGRIYVWCSGRDTVIGTNIHTNFKLTQTKPEEIVLMDAAQILLDSLTLNPTQTNHSRGRTTDGASTWSLFTTPTPGSVNSGAKIDYVPQPVFSKQSAFYGAAQSVSIACSDPAATIYYTTDGSTPTTSSLLYSGPVNITQTTVLRARAFNPAPGIEPSFVQSASYFINVTHSVAVVSVFGDQIETLLNGQQIDPETGLHYFDKTNAYKAFSYGTSNEHGNDSWAYQQRGIDFISHDQMGYNYAIKDQLFHMKSRKEFQRIILKAAANDNYPFSPGGSPPNSPGGAHIRDAYVMHLSQLGGLAMDERSYEPCVMYVNGQYWGVYEIREKVDDDDFTSYYYNQDVPNIQMLKTWGGTWSEYGGAQAQTDWDNLKNFILGNSMAVQSNYDYVDSLYNTKSLIDYIALNSFVVCKDWLNWNTQWWRGLDPNGDKKKWRYCLWDEDATFGHYINYTGVPNTGSDADPCDPSSLGDPGNQGHVPVLNALLNNPEFKQEWVNRYVDLINSTFNCQYMNFVLDSLINIITPEMPGHVQRWGGNMTDWQTNVQYLRDFIDDRCIDISQGFIDCYDLKGPYNISVDVSPPASGTVDVNTLHLTNFNWSGKYYGNININLKANALTGYKFDYWTIDLDTLFPSTTDSIVTIALDTNVNVVAYFKINDSIPGPPEPLSTEVFVPNAFSPNGDQNNDVLYILGPEIVSMDFQVFNRWGMLVFQSNNIQSGWDGTYKGELLNSDVFVYQLKATMINGETIKRKGNITLMR